MNILVTGGAGYIGSHTCVALLHAGHAVTVIDHLGNSRAEVLDRVQTLGGRAFSQTATCRIYLTFNPCCK